MKNFLNIMLLTLTICLLTGCEEPYTLEEKYDMCVDEFVVSKDFDFFYYIQDDYATVEDTYQEFVQLSLWSAEKASEIEDIFKYYNYMHDDDLEDSADKVGLDWYKIDEDKLEDKLQKEKNILISDLNKKQKEYVLQIINSSCEEVQMEEDVICKELDCDGMDYIARAEKARMKNDCKEMIIIIYNTDFPKQMFHKIYPEEMFQGAMECLENVSTSDSIEKASACLRKIGRYEEFADDIEWAYVKAHYLWRCDYGNCQSEGDTASERHPGQYCSAHAHMLDNGGKRKEKTQPTRGGSGGWLPVPNDSTNESSGGSLSNNSSSSTDKKEEVKPDDPYNVYDYYDPEDFYYDNYDDFFDFEDAEDYWNDAWDKVN